jgi:predicted transcriptional regulator
MYMRGSKGRAQEPNRQLAQVGIPTPTAADCIKAISAPQRRHLLRALHDAGEARSPNELAEALGLMLGNVSYHVKALSKCGVVAMTDAQPRRGAVEHFYASTVMNNELVVRFLEATRANDD